MTDESAVMAAEEIVRLQEENERLRKALEVYATSRFWRGVLNGVWMFYAPTFGVDKKGIGIHPSEIARRALDGGE